MKDFNIAKYLRENSLGSHAILGAYVDLHALKEEEVGNNKPVDEVPYVGAEKKLDGFGDEFDQVAPVEEAEMEENAWMEDVDGTDAYKVGNWTCYYDHPGLLIWSYKDIPFSKLAIYATPNYDGDDTTPIQIDVNGENDDMMALNQGIFADFNEYARAMKPYLDRIEDLESNWGSLAPVEEIYDNSEQDKFDRMMGLAHEYFEKVSPIVRKTIDALRADGFDDQDIMDFLATDFTLEEEVSVSSSGIEMEEVAKDEFSNIINTLNGIAKKVKPTGAKLSFDDDSSSDAILVQVVTKDGDSKLQKAVHTEVKKLVQKANSGFKVSRIEQDSPGRISFSIDKSKLDEELGGEEEWQWSARDQQGNLYGTLYVKPMGDTLVVTADDGMPGTRYSKEDIIDAMGRGEFLRFRGKNFALDTRMKDWANS